MSEHLPGQPGLAQPDLTPVIEQQTCPMPDHTPAEGTRLLDRLRSRWTTGVAVGVAAVAIITAPSFEEQPAYAATTKVAEIGMPFGGKWGSAASGQADVHTKYSGNWAQDLFANGADVQLNASAPNGGALSFDLLSTWQSCNGAAGKGIKIAVKVDNEKVGEVSYAHLDQMITSGPITNGMVLGKTKKWDPVENCWEVATDAGVHAHFEAKSDAGNYACYYARPVTTVVNSGTAIARLGKTSATGEQQACTETPGGTPPPPPPTPYNMNVKFDSDNLSDLVVSRYVGGFVVASGASGSTLVDSPPKLSLTNWTVPKWAGTGDFNGDGSTDVLVEWPSGFGVALGHPNGIFTEGGVTLPGWSTGNWAGTGNFAGDYRTDLVVARAAGGFALAHANPNGTLNEGLVSLPDWTVQSWAGVGDFNGDYYSDILIAKPVSDGGGFALALGHQDGVFTDGGLTLPGWGTGIWAATGNFAGDERHDLVVAKPGGGFAIAHANPNGTLNEGQESLPGWSVSSWAGTADIDGDGYTDILIARPEGGFAVAKGNQDGIFTAGPVVALPGWGVQNWAGNGAFVNSKGYGYTRP